jgi:hypothetical protein
VGLAAPHFTAGALSHPIPRRSLKDLVLAILGLRGVVDGLQAWVIGTLAKGNGQLWSGSHL